MCEFSFSAKLLTNTSRSLSLTKAGTHSALPEKSHTAAHTPKHGASLLPLREAFRFLRCRSPAGLRCLVCNLAVLLFFRFAFGTFCMCEARGVSPLSACSTCRRNARCPLVKAANSPFPCLARFFFDSSSAKYCPLSLQMPKGPAGYPLVLSLLFASPYLP